MEIGKVKIPKFSICKAQGYLQRAGTPWKVYHAVWYSLYVIPKRQGLRILLLLSKRHILDKSPVSYEMVGVWMRRMRSQKWGGRGVKSEWWNSFYKEIIWKSGTRNKGSVDKEKDSTDESDSRYLQLGLGINDIKAYYKNLCMLQLVSSWLTVYKKLHIWKWTGCGQSWVQYKSQ